MYSLFFFESNVFVVPKEIGIKALYIDNNANHLMVLQKASSMGRGEES